MDEFVVEAFDEAVGTSPKKWALVVLALVAGAVGALWLTRRRRQATPEVVPTADVA